MGSLAIYPGTFDPITNGHLDIAKRALKIFDRVIIALAVNPKKTPLFSSEERYNMLNAIKKDNPELEVDSFDGLLVNYAQKVGANAIIRGLRAVSDFEYEFQMALMNRWLDNRVETLYIMTAYRWIYTSSSIIKEASMAGGNVKGLVPDYVNAKLNEKFAVLQKK